MTPRQKVKEKQTLNQRNPDDDYYCNMCFHYNIISYLHAFRGTL